MALYGVEAEDAEMNVGEFDAVFLTQGEFAATGAATDTATDTATGPSNEPLPDCPSGVYDVCGVCDGNGLSCAAEPKTHHITILVSLLAFTAVMVFAFISCARCRPNKRRRARRAWRGYEPV